jgi:hypothetical protein
MRDIEQRWNAVDSLTCIARSETSRSPSPQSSRRCSTSSCGRMLLSCTGQRSRGTKFIAHESIGQPSLGNVFVPTVATPRLRPEASWFRFTRALLYRYVKACALSTLLQHQRDRGTSLRRVEAHPSLFVVGRLESEEHHVAMRKPTRGRFSKGSTVALPPSIRVVSPNTPQQASGVRLMPSQASCVSHCPSRHADHVEWPEAT